ncbi:hypothetical protein [Polymorphobacter megasporae]|uniref:hypothetical protein n=1 Tax=Glacieibacterium megasporae TaxID=2835787 RepID=UPI001C1E2845|nr:hypothetical protein [Polymorphobacter megasporae]UAJ11058.1 hypothetical protein KTC28_04920 [Polymorphobacter megasporae]
MTDERNGDPSAVASARIEIDGTARRFGSVEVVSLTVFHVPEVRPGVPGPWDGEADKIAWTDPATGMACIIRRSRHGHLCGYVAVEPEHPLFGYEADALPRDAALIVHGGVSYAQACEHRRPIARSVWRRPPTPDAPPAWWFGFECDQISDEVPGRSSCQTAVERRPSLRDHPGGGVHTSVYWREAEVYRECVSLAAQLDAVANGSPMPVVSTTTEPEDDR